MTPHLLQSRSPTLNDSTTKVHESSSLPTVLDPLSNFCAACFSHEHLRIQIVALLPVNPTKVLPRLLQDYQAALRFLAQCPGSVFLVILLFNIGCSLGMRKYPQVHPKTWSLNLRKYPQAHPNTTILVLKILTGFLAVDVYTHLCAIV